MILKIKKEYFQNLSKGTHTLKVKFNDGHAEGTFVKDDKITFYIIDTQCTATKGMTWEDWFASGLSTSGNNFVVREPRAAGNRLYLNHVSGALDYRLNVFGFSKDMPSYESNDLGLFATGDTEQQLATDTIQNGFTYGLSGGGAGGDNAPE
jgi:hypothetical protein